MLALFHSGGPVMYPLLLCSLIVFTVILDRIIFWLGVSRQRDQRLLDEVLALCQTGDWEAVRRRVAGSRDYLIRVLVSGIVHREFSMGRAMEAAAEVELRRMGRFMGVLDTMITVAPLLGIFGTVVGIISSFEMLGQSGIEHPGLVTAGIAQALLTTAAGLGIAILSVFPYNYCNARLATAAHEMEKYATSLEIVYEKLVQAKEQGRGAA